MSEYELFESANERTANATALVFGRINEGGRQSTHGTWPRDTFAL